MSFRELANKPPPTRLKHGALLGLGGAALALSLGVLRWLAAAIGGGRRTLPGVGDLSFFFGYVGSFVVSGALLGLCWPLTRQPAVRVLVFALCGTMLLVGIVATSDLQLLLTGGVVVWTMLPVCGLTGGLIAMYYFERDGQFQRPNEEL